MAPTALAYLVKWYGWNVPFLVASSLCAIGAVLYSTKIDASRPIEHEAELAVMKINPEKCVACGNCTYVCPMGAIYIDQTIHRATINRDECVECYACFNGLSQEHLNPTFVRTVRKIFQTMRLRFDPEPDVCPTAAFEPDELAWPRIVRRAFSDPRVPHESTGVHGRGTEEVKTNRRERAREGGRGGIPPLSSDDLVWARGFATFQKMCTALARTGVAFEEEESGHVFDERRGYRHDSRGHP